jgi:hypothetical protein
VTAASIKAEIKSRWTGGVLFTAELAASYASKPDDVKLGAAVKEAVKARANLTGADLTGATDIQREQHIDLLMLLDQPGPIRAYKLVAALVPSELGRGLPRVAC